jgi:hypothetical protein
MLLASLLGAVLLATAPPDAAHAALARVLATDSVAGGCSAPERRAAERSAEIVPLGRAAGRDVVLAGVHDPCMCGEVNCPWFVLRLGDAPAVLLSTIAFTVDPFRGPEMLPRLREHAHDSALVTDETIDVFRAGRYVTLASARVRGDTGARKPNAVPVRFRPGTSSARLRGNVAVGWYDEYAVVAQRGQRLEVDGVQSPARLGLTLFGPADSQLVDLRPGVPVTLQHGGMLLLHVDADSEGGAPYALTLSIR